ncbi:hypothetical protein THAOC_11882 [Thalassiosira oceanica]|uniref:Uncharacterized protein n=1 Tax=Thalassiosira oceanica TaxID=159749 RepID=K0SP38_THAOC|nr:hypothetical protein THAOC_11882 [Thalassiosira oceanica]|eukprot:EJK67125.1 hypothetical protein THAOC_11882 [Thalassiosira oceanica]
MDSITGGGAADTVGRAPGPHPFPGGDDFASAAACLASAPLWSARAIVAHRRLISTRRDDDDGNACPTLWNEAEATFAGCLSSLGGGDGGRRPFGSDDARNRRVASEVNLEWGLAQHHFRRVGRGKGSFSEALGISGLEVEVTGAEGKRTKYQQKATAQYLVRAKPTPRPARTQEGRTHTTINLIAEKSRFRYEGPTSSVALLN